MLSCHGVIFGLFPFCCLAANLYRVFTQCLKNIVVLNRTVLILDSQRNLNTFCLDLSIVKASNEKIRYLQVRSVGQTAQSPALELDNLQGDHGASFVFYS